MLTDNELLEKYESGDNGAIEEIIERYKTMVNAIARRYYLVGGDQDDLVQEGMTGLFKACLNYKKNNISTFKTFAYICIKHQIQTAIKQANSQKNMVLNSAIAINSQGGIVVINKKEDFEDDEENFIYLPAPTPTPEDKIIARENFDEMIEEIKLALSLYEFEVLEHYIKGHKTASIATLMNKDFKSIDNALVRIKSKLTFLKTI